MTTYIINPGTGPVGGALERDADENISVFIAELGLDAPAIQSKRDRKGDDRGRFSYRLSRGIRECYVDMPGRPLEEVRPDDAIGYRLYIDGNSWFWKFALRWAMRALLDHDGARQKLSEEREAAANAELEAQPHCPCCGAIRVVESFGDWQEEEEYGCVIRCLLCTPKTWDGTDQYGRPARFQLMPAEALGTDEEPLCGALVGKRAGRYCRLRRRHPGACEGYYKQLPAKDPP